MDRDWTESTTVSCADSYCDAMVGTARTAVFARSCRSIIYDFAAMVELMLRKI